MVKTDSRYVVDSESRTLALSIEVYINIKPQAYKNGYITGRSMAGRPASDKKFKIALLSNILRR